MCFSRTDFKEKVNKQFDKFYILYFIVSSTYCKNYYKKIKTDRSAGWSRSAVVEVCPSSLRSSDRIVYYYCNIRYIGYIRYGQWTIDKYNLLLYYMVEKDLANSETRYPLSRWHTTCVKNTWIDINLHWSIVLHAVRVFDKARAVNRSCGRYTLRWSL